MGIARPPRYAFLAVAATGQRAGIIVRAPPRRCGGTGRRPLRGAALADLVAELQRRCAAGTSVDAATPLRWRDPSLREAGGLNYDHSEQAFRSVARTGLAGTSDAESFRHGFATLLGNTLLAEAYKKYLPGQSVGRAALMACTHLNDVRQQYATAVRRAWTPLVEASLQRLQATAPRRQQSVEQVGSCSCRIAMSSRCFLRRLNTLRRAGCRCWSDRPR